MQVWSSSYHEASVALQRRQEAVAAQAEAIETNLTLLEATAVEDFLQEIHGVTQPWVVPMTSLSVHITLACLVTLFGVKTRRHTPLGPPYPHHPRAHDVMI